jgi:hypothetical protein
LTPLLSLRPGTLDSSDRKKEDDAGEGMSGEMESDGDGEKGKCQDEDRAEAEGGGSADKRKGKERDGSRTESRL